MAQTSGVLKKTEPILPKTPSSTYPLEKELLTNVLRKYENDPFLKVTNVELIKACKAGDNYMSTILRAFVDGIRSNGKYFHCSFIMKRQIDNMEKRKVFKVDEVWANEETMYFTILPRLRRYCTKDLPHPKIYYSDREIMVMEDLKEAGYSMGDRLIGLDLQQSMVVMQNIALFHSASLSMKKLDHNLFDTIQSSMRHPYNEPDNYSTAASFIRQAIVSLQDSFDQDNTFKKIDRITGSLKKLENGLENNLKLFIDKPTNDLAVLIHGDLWVNNILFKYEASNNEPTVAKFVDFQGTRFGSIALDILHFLFSSVQPNIRKKYSNVLLKVYHEYLIKFLRDFVGIDSEEYVGQFSFERIESEVKKHRIYGLINALLILPVVMCEEKNISNNNDTMQNGNNQNSKFRERLIDIIEEYASNGWMDEV